MLHTQKAAIIKGIFSSKGHGTGFCDRPELYGEDRHSLQEIAKGMWGKRWFVSDDGEIEQY